MINIPPQLQNEDFRFIKLKENSKSPIDGVKWQTTLYQFNSQELLSHPGNYGVVGGFGKLRVLDIDIKDIAEKLFNLPLLDTLVIKTPGGTYHFYFISEYSENHVFPEGELRGNMMYVVGPNCHAIDNKKKHEGDYTIIKDLPIKTLSTNEVKTLLNEFKLEKEIEFDVENEIVDKSFIEKKILPNIPQTNRALICENLDKIALNRLGLKSRSERDQKVIVSLVMLGFSKYIKSIFELFPIGDKYKEHNDGEAYLEFNIKSARKFTGVHDDNFLILEKEIDNLPANVLRNKINDYLIKISKIKNNILQQYILGNIAFKIKVNKKELQLTLSKLLIGNKLEIPRSLCEIWDSPAPLIDYHLNPILPKGKLILIGAKPGQFKSMFTLSMCLSMKEGKNFLNTYKSNTSPKILYYDLENGEETILWRTKYLANGMNILKEELKNIKIKYSFLKDDLEKELEEAMKYDIINLDSYRRFLPGDENKTENTDMFFREFLMPLKNAGKTILIQHHFKKAKLSEIDDEDLMDIFRGSSDIPAQFDLIYALDKTEEEVDASGSKTSFDVNVFKVKNRLGLPIKNFTFGVEKDDALQRTTLQFIGNYPNRKFKDKIKHSILEFLKANGISDRKTIFAYVQQLDETVSEISVARYLKELLLNFKISQPEFGKYEVFKIKQKKEVVIQREEVPQELPSNVIHIDTDTPTINDKNLDDFL